MFHKSVFNLGLKANPSMSDLLYFYVPAITYIIFLFPLYFTLLKSSKEIVVFREEHVTSYSSSSSSSAACNTVVYNVMKI